MNDIIERKRIEQELEQRNRDLDLIYRVSQTLTATLELEQVIERLMRAVTETIGAEAGSVWLWDSERPGGLVCQGAAYPGPKRTLANLRLDPGEGIAGWVARSGESAIVPCAPRDPRFSPRIDNLIGFHTRSVLAVPLRTHDQVMGVLEAVNKLSGDFDDHDHTLVETLVSSAAIAIENAQLVETLRRQTAELQTRNLELDAFAHTVAHDLKSPLSLVIGYAELSEDCIGAEVDGQLRSNLNQVIRNSRKMSRIVDDLLLLAEVRSAELYLAPLDMARIVAEAQERLTNVIKEHQAQIILPSVWPVAMGYAPWVEEVWANYISNAIKYGGRPPRLELGADSLPDPSPLAGESGLLAAAEGGGMVRFWVRDNGLGLSAQEQTRLFTPFTRLDQVKVKGHGLGLSIVRRIVEKLGGQVGVESQIGQGSTFSFTLPGAPR